MTVIGLAGQKGVGKSTLAKQIINNAKGSIKICSFAAPLKAMLSTLGIEPEYLYGNKKECKTWTGKTGRHMAQTLGTDWGRNMICPDLWHRCMERQVALAKSDGYNAVLIDDVRFPNEVNWIHKNHGTVVQLHGPSSKKTKDPHISEKPLEKVDFKLSAKINTKEWYTPDTLVYHLSRLRRFKPKTKKEKNFYFFIDLVT